MISTPTDVLRAHRHLYEVMANPNPNVVQSHFRHLEDYSAVAEHHHAVPLDRDKDHCVLCGTRITRVKGPDGLPLKPVPEIIYRVAR